MSFYLLFRLPQRSQILPDLAHALFEHLRRDQRDPLIVAGVDEPLTRIEAAAMAAKAREVLRLPARDIASGEGAEPMTRAEFTAFAAVALDLAAETESEKSDSSVVKRGEAADIMTRAMERVSRR